ncbi:DNA polymerase III subunit beta [Verrucomicrobium sp. BvORR034]|uniref:DNA polymerase III subunit beta n=1 Tax=Verrucomicrobium sp. BvORR034 TaxID=1396418 RepID=UPI0006789C1B|nr:DNA polymerase III subunit beta [Verrucomicrobium sp. BvORR034]
MNFTTTQPELKRLAALLRPLGLPKSSLPVLTHLRLEANGSGITAYATDLETALIAPLQPTQIDPDPSFHASLPVEFLLRVAREADKDTSITWALADSQLELRWSSQGVPMHESAPCLPHHDFPAIDTSGHEHGLWVGAPLLEAFRQALSHVSEDTTRHVLMGVFLDHEDHRIVATDGRRLFCSRSPVALPCSVIIPTAAASFLADHMGEEGPIWFKTPPAGEGQVPYASSIYARLAGNAFYTCKTIEGVFPRYQQVIPWSSLPHEAHLTMERDTLLKQLRHVSSVDARLAFRMGDGILAICYRPTPQRPFTDWIAVGTTAYQGPAVVSAFCGAYFTQAIQSLTSPVLRFLDELSPIMLESGPALTVIMPMRIEGEGLPDPTRLLANRASVPPVFPPAT